MIPREHTKSAGCQRTERCSTRWCCATPSNRCLVALQFRRRLGVHHSIHEWHILASLCEDGPSTLRTSDANSNLVGIADCPSYNNHPDPLQSLGFPEHPILSPSDADLRPENVTLNFGRH